MVILTLKTKNMGFGKRLIFAALLVGVCALLPVGESRSVGSFVKVNTLSIKSYICR